MSKKMVWIMCVCLLCLVCYGGFQSKWFQETMQENVNKKMVVIDSGHGGVDPGKVGVSGVKEKDVNLAIAKKVEEKLKKKGYTVIMTRKEDMGLYAKEDPNKKRVDMQNRVKIIDESGAFLAVSIHQNSFTSASSKGAQVFYFTKSEEGKKAAEIMQEVLKQKVDKENHRMAKANDSYYMLRKTQTPLVIVECGFLSNPVEEKQLASEDYQNKVAEGIVAGIENA